MTCPAAPAAPPILSSMPPPAVSASDAPPLNGAATSPPIFIRDPRKLMVSSQQAEQALQPVLIQRRAELRRVLREALAELLIAEQRR
jgi:hypothetical protein